MSVTDYKVVGGYYTTRNTPQINAVVAAAIADGWTPYGAPMLRGSGWVDQPMVKGNRGSVTAYRVLTGYSDNRTPRIATLPGWEPLGDTVRLDSAYFLQAYIQGTPYEDLITPLGLGSDNQATDVAFNWQQADFVSGEMKVITFASSINPPAGVSYAAGTTVTVHCLQARTNLVVVRLIPLTATTGNIKHYVITISGAKGARTFKVNQLLTNDSSSVTPVANGGTGVVGPYYLDCSNPGTTSFPAGAYTAIPFTTQTEATRITKTGNTVFTPSTAGVYLFEVEVRINGGAANMPPVGTPIQLILQGAVPTSIRPGYSVADTVEAVTTIRLTCLARLAANAAQSVYLFNGGAAAYQVTSANIKIVRLCS